MNRFFRHRNLYKYCAILLFLWCLGVLHAQQRQQARQPTRANLEEQSQRLQRQIQTNNRMLEEASRNRRTNVQQLTIINSQINQREELILTITNEISAVDSDIQTIENEITTLEGNIQDLIDEYTRLIVATHRHRNPSQRFLFIVASESFHQAYRRIIFFRQYSEHRKRQVELIRERQSELSELRSELEQEKNTKAELLSREQAERRNLDTERARRNRTISDLQRRERELRAENQRHEAERRRLSQQIERIIQQEIEAAARRAAEEAARRGQVADVAQLTPEEQQLANEFVSNRGRLPWPTERGLITERFGTHDHPVIRGIRVNNDGITITTPQNEPVRAVFNGTVVAIQPFGNTSVVIIVHGNYRTVYTNLASVSVRIGQAVTTRQTIGVVHRHDGRDFVGFQLWRDLQKLDPEQWLARR
ncbi:MAG: peptidoglycan DD-metalloendopeptidase family protein [Bacteroidales bacterium]|nr:peptidoglycan DD-metalloendopeptidase family protein [Bacteroidales bacterium]